MVAIAASLVAAVAAGLWAVSLRQENRALRDTAAATGSDIAQQLAAARARTQALEGEVARLQQPAVALNVPLIDLEPIGALRSGALPTVSVSKTAPLVTLVLAVTGTPAREGYALEIRDPSDRVIWTGQGLVATSMGTVTLAVPRALLPAGTLTLRLTAAGRHCRSSIRRPRRRSAVNGLRVAVVLLTTAASWPGYAVLAQSGAARNFGTIAAGARVEHSLGAGESGRYAVRAAAGDYVRVVVERPAPIPCR